jgi:signal transduction histidine kinase
MMQILEFLGKRSKRFILVSAFVSVALLGVIDFLTGHELSFSVFYLLPVSAVAWFVGMQAGIVTSVLAAASWLIADLLARATYSHPAIPLWNSLVRLGFYLIVTSTLSLLHDARQRQESLIQFVVHDLRSPLSVMLTGFQSLQEFGGENLNEFQRSVVGYGIAAGNRMVALINTILDLSRLESGKMPVQLEQVNASDLVQLSVEQIRLWAQENQIALVVQVDAETDAVLADPDLSLRALVNLLSNAIKFSPRESTITVRVAPAGGKMLAFSVMDQGSGIPEEWQDRVFEKFVHVDARASATRAGSGLGLYFCQLAVEAQGGRIWLDRAEEQGTTITFVLPRVEAAQQ